LPEKENPHEAAPPMKKSHTCHCGKDFEADPDHSPTIRCPGCGHLIWYRTRTNLTREDFDRMVEAAYEALSDGDTPPFSGAR